MKIAVMGTGGVGGVFGARLAAAGNDVSFIARGKHLEAIKRDGLRVRSELRGDVTIHPAVATSEPSEIGTVDVVLFTVKLWDTESAAETIKPLIGPQTAVLSLQNGIERDAILGRHVGAQHVIGGVSYVASNIMEPGVILQKGNAQDLVFGEYSKQFSERVLALKAACDAASIGAEISKHIERTIWEKFVWLVAMSAVLSATRQTIGPVMSNPLTRQLMRDVMSETIAVGKASGVDLDEQVLESRMKYGENLAPDVIASMLHDLRSGNRLELPWLSGAVVSIGEKYGVPTPVNKTLVAVLSPYVNGNVTD